MDKEDWNRRYAAQEIEPDAEPAGFLAKEFSETEPRGRALDLACGQGRNAVWLAERGWDVTAVDYAEVAISHARQLAAARGVRVEWIEADVATYVPPPASFQLVVIAYLQVPAAHRRKVLAHAATALAPGGTLFMVGHARLNLNQGTGGPKNPDVLWEPSEIERELAGLGLAVQRVEHASRSEETPEGVKTAIDTVARAERR